MMTTREPGQSKASSDALEDWVRAAHAASDARVDVVMQRKKLRLLVKAAKEAEALEAEALRKYESTPYSEDEDAR